MFYTWEVSGCPHVHMPPYIFMPHIPPYSSMPLCVFGGFACCGGCNGLPFVLRHPPIHHLCLGVLPLYYTPHIQSLAPCALVCFRDISMLCGHFPSGQEWFGGFPPSVGGWRHQHLRCPYAHSCTFFVVHYVSCFDYSSDYYSSSYSGIFLACLPCHQ